MDPYDGLPPEKPIEPDADPVADTDGKDLVKKDEAEKPAEIPLANGLPAPTSVEQLWRLSTLLAKSKMVPRDYTAGYNGQSVTEAAQKIMVATFLGNEIGLHQMAALRSIAVINGRPSVWGDAVPALVLATGNIEWVKEYFKGTGDALTAVCEVQKKGYPEPFIATFSVEDAKRADLWEGGKKGKKETWIKYPRRMLKMRAREAYRDAEPGALMGMLIAEVAQDLPPVDVTPPSDQTVRSESPAAEPEVMEADVSPAGAEPATEAKSPPAPTVTDHDSFEWLVEFIEREEISQLPDVGMEQLKIFITEAGKTFEASDLEVQKQALQNFDAFWSQFNSHLRSEGKQDTISGLQAEMDKVTDASKPDLKKDAGFRRPEEPVVENFWHNDTKWKFLGGQNFKNVVESNLEDLYRMPDDFIASIKLRWEKTKGDLGPFPSIEKATPEPEPQGDDPVILKELRDRLAYFEINHEEAWKEARRALGIHVSNDELDLESCDHLLVQIEMILENEKGF